MKNTAYILLVSTIFLLSAISCKKSETPEPSIVSKTAGAPPPMMPTLPTPITKAVTNKTGACPSEHLNFQFPSDGILKMIDIGIIQSGTNEYFSTIGFNGGYCGLQQTSDLTWHTPYIGISSLWNSAANGDSNIDYIAPGLTGQPFGGEGTGEKTIGSYKNGWQH